ncbi:hypothetical protein RBB79_00920 [Tunturiibacter empetritectus]|uniref:Uncharacterized protein n=1 Tax=Tunturiibacter lichenicola TaxID=2051959 RepID=A0A852VB66_9BACT|nr:hypothetical protein [Edaphobacter lichenicola]NYF88049.1 hypothetical protein [Edaphobacter lichenicola]
MKIFTAVIFLWVSSISAQTTSIRIQPVDLPKRPASLSRAISFSCTLDYDPSQCLTSASLLAKVLERYPTEKMGQWTFVLAGSAHWRKTIKQLGGDPESPAFSELSARVTVLEEELFETVGSRQSMVARRFGLPPGSILDYAVTHEMGHAICGELQEKLAEKYGSDLRRGTAPICAIYGKRINTP